MKPTLYLFALSLIGCSAKSPYDVSSTDVQHRQILHGVPGLPDLKHLPKGAKKEEHTYKKGETLPDGTIAQGDVHIVRVTTDHPGATEMSENKTEDIRTQAPN
jgi:hypothetical protein